MIHGVFLIILGILAAPSLLLSRKPEAKEFLNKITPYQEWIGLVFCIWGIWGVISILLNLKTLSILPNIWVLSLAVRVVAAVLGFLLSYTLMNNVLLSKNEDVKEKAAALRVQLMPLQGKFGMAAIFIGAFYILVRILN